MLPWPNCREICILVDYIHDLFLSITKRKLEWRSFAKLTHVAWQFSALLQTVYKRSIFWSFLFTLVNDSEIPVVMDTFSPLIWVDLKDRATLCRKTMAPAVGMQTLTPTVPQSAPNHPVQEYHKKHILSLSLMPKQGPNRLQHIQSTWMNKDRFSEAWQ